MHLILNTDLLSCNLLNYFVVFWYYFLGFSIDNNVICKRMDLFISLPCGYILFFSYHTARARTSITRLNRSEVRYSCLLADFKEKT